MPRRYHYYYFAPEFQIYNIMSSLGSTVLALGLLMPAFYLTHSLFNGAKAAANPWGAHGLEWETTSPPPQTNFYETPIVTDEVYDFDPVAEYEQMRATAEITHPGHPVRRASRPRTAIESARQVGPRPPTFLKGGQVVGDHCPTRASPRTTPEHTDHGHARPRSAYTTSTRTSVSRTSATSSGCGPSSSPR